MALKQLLKRQQLETARKAAADHREARAVLDQRRDALEKREAAAESALEELTAESTQEERRAVEEEVDAIEAEQNKLKDDEEAHDAEQGRLDTIVSGLESEIAAIDERSVGAVQVRNNKFEGEIKVEHRKFFGMNHQERDAFFARNEVKDFLQRVRDLSAQKRAVTGADLLIPDVVLEIVREQTAEASKLHKHVNVQRVPGKARQNVVGPIPEAVWTEMCAKLNELSIVFNSAEVDGYKVGGYIPICNALLEDSDVSLASEIISMLGKAIGIALDKAILYGTGTKMPMGILTRLAQTDEPSDYPANAREWKDLRGTNIISIAGKADVELFKAVVVAAGSAKGKYSRGGRFWAMSDATHAKLIANALSINAAGAIATGINNTMPVIGGSIETLDFIPDDVIIGGYGDLYLLAERAGTMVGRSEHAMFIEDHTVFKATARYDGMPVIPEGFVAIGINGNTPSASAVTFTVGADNAYGEEEND